MCTIYILLVRFNQIHYWHIESNSRISACSACQIRQLKEISSAKIVNFIVWAMNVFIHLPMTTFDALEEKKNENIVGKENAGNQHFLLFPQCFLSYERQL